MYPYQQNWSIAVIFVKEGFMLSPRFNTAGCCPKPQNARRGSVMLHSDGSFISQVDSSVRAEQTKIYAYHTNSFPCTHALIDSHSTANKMLNLTKTTQQHRDDGHSTVRTQYQLGHSSEALRYLTHPNIASRQYSDDQMSPIQYPKMQVHVHYHQSNPRKSSVHQKTL